eukprot:8380235-Pyramimonas_sp.AAC.1
MNSPLQRANSRGPVNLPPGPANGPPALCGKWDLPPLRNDSPCQVVGENAIPFKVVSWRAGLVEEFLTFFYLYQFGCYTLWIWF